MSSTTQHYDLLFSELTRRFGPLSDLTHTAIIGFAVGGPVSMVQVEGRPIYVTCELSLYPEQIASAEGHRYELLLQSDTLAPADCQRLLTALGTLGFNAKLGDGHSIDTSGISPPGGPALVKLRHFSSAMVGGETFSVYEVVARKRKARVSAAPSAA